MRARLSVLLLLIVISASGSICFAQTDNRTRTRQIDNAEFKELQYGVHTVSDKAKGMARLLALTSQLFTAEDEEYFNVHLTIGNIYEHTLMDYSEAMLHYQQAIEAYEKHYPFYHGGYPTVSEETALSGYLYLASAYNNLSLFDKSIKLLESKQKILEAKLSPIYLTEFYNYYAKALYGATRYEESVQVALKLKSLTESGALTQRMPSADEIYKINPNDPPEVQEQMKKAKDLYEKAIAQSGSTNDMTLVAKRIKYNKVLADAYFEQFQFAESLPYAEAFVKDLHSMFDLSREANKFGLDQAKAYGVPDATRKHIEDALQFSANQLKLGGWNTTMIIAASKSNKKEQAKPYLTGLFDHAIFFQLSGQFDEAEKHYQAAFKLLDDMSSSNSTSKFKEQLYYGGLGANYTNLLTQMEKFDKAYNESLNSITHEEDQLRKNFTYFSEGEKKEFFKAYNQKLEKHLSLLFLMTEKNNDRSEEILNKLLQTKGIILDLTRDQEKKLKKLNDKIVTEQIKQVKKLRQKLAAFYQISQQAPNAALADSINRYSILISNLEQKVNEKLGAATDVLKPVSWKQVQAKLKQDEVYLEILRLKRDNFNFDKPITQYWAFAVKKGVDKPVLFKLSEGEAFDGRGLKGYQNRIKSLIEDNESYGLFWAKISESLQGTNKIFMSSDGAYHMINPLTLKDPANGKFLVNEISLKRVSTGRDFLLDDDKVTANSTIALVGNPAFGMSRKGTLNSYQGKELDITGIIESVTRSGFASLPGTQQEVQSIHTMATSQGIRTEVLSGTQANESRVKSLQNPHILHVATHGEFDQLSKADSYLKSKLILAGAADAEPLSIEDYTKYEDGFLTAYEVTQLELSQTNLVTLSACETGLGEIQSGEGVWGLQRAFQLAGAKNVMGSLWKISDEATAVFMEAFYKNYLSTSNIHQAYQQAMEATMGRHPDPYYWGAFILTE